MTISLQPTVSAYGAEPARAPELARGALVGRYIVLECIGQGGMGTVYKAYDPDLDRNVALKLVSAESRNPDHRARLRTRLLREAQTLAQLAHPNVVAVHDVGAHDDDVFIAMELVDGTTLTRVLAGAPPLARILELFGDAARGLAAAHAVSIIHRDFKPDNVIVGRDGRVRVVDFGLARAVPGEIDDAGAAALAIGSAATASGLVVGTPAYMAPEQLAGVELDARADQFSFCVALHEALFGVRATAEPAAVPSHTPSGARVSGRLRAALLRGLARDPAARHPSMHALLEQLTGRPRRLWIAGGAAIGAIGLALAIAATRGDDPAARCDGLDARLAGVWDPARRAAVGDALERHGDVAAPATVLRLLDDYTAAWLAMHTASCRATRVLGEQSAELLDLRTQCLDRRLAEVRYLSDALVAADRDTAGRAVASVRALAPLDDCANTVALRDPIPPRTPALAGALRDDLARVRVAFAVGKYPDTARDAAALASAAAIAGDRWLEASATYLAARAARQLGQIPRAEDGLYRAIAIAETGRASDVVVDAWMTLAWIAAEDRDRFSDALRLAGVAGGVLERLGGNPRLEASLEDHLGVLHLDRHELDLARRHLERGLALREKLYGPHNADYAASLQHIAMLEEFSGDMAKAIELYHRARTIAEAELGPQHFDVLAMVSSEGSALYKSEHFADTIALLTPELARAEHAAGPTSELAASFLTQLGLAHWQLKHHADARAALERSFAIHVHNDGESSLDAGTLHLDLALLQIDTGEIAAAHAHAERAVAIFEKVLGHGDADVAMALEALATTHLRAAHPALAVPILERAVAIRATATGAGAAPNDLAATQFDLAKAIIAAHGPTAHARQLAADARLALERIGDTDGAREVSTWLAATAR